MKSEFQFLIKNFDFLPNFAGIGEISGSTQNRVGIIILFYPRIYRYFINWPVGKSLPYIVFRIKFTKPKHQNSCFFEKEIKVLVFNPQVPFGANVCQFFAILIVNVQLIIDRREQSNPRRGLRVKIVHLENVNITG